MFRPRERNLAAKAPESARRGRRQPVRPKRVWNPEMERLEIRITPATRSWTGLGVDNNWTTAANWDVTPVANDDLVFPDIADSARHTAVNDFAAGTPFGSIQIQEAGYTLSGNALSQPGGLTATYASGTSTINIATTLSSSFPNSVSVQGGTLVLGGALSGSNGINKQGGGLALFTQANTYSGVTTVSAGTLAIANSSALGSSTAGNGTNVTAGASLEIRGTINTSEPITITGTGVGGLGSLYNGTGNNVVQAVNMTANATIGVAPGTFMLIPSTLGESGGTGFNLTKVGAGVLDVLATASYTGSTTVAAGTLAVEGTLNGTIAVDAGATVAGAGGNLGDVISTGGSVNPGFATSPFTTDINSLTLDASSTLVVSLAGNTPGNGSTGYSRFNSANTSLGGATLSLSIGGGYVPAPGDSLTIISNAEGSSGTFNGLPEGSYVSLGVGRTFRITYAGGSGSDVVLKFVDDTATTITSSANPSSSGQSVTFTATVAPIRGGGPTPTGTVTFKDGATTLGTVTLVNGIASYTTNALTTGSHSLSSVFNGDAATAPSTSSQLTQVVSLPATTTSFTASPNPSVYGQTVTFTATVTGSGSPTGTVTFFDGSTALDSVPLSNGVATYLTSALAAGGHSITASYSGDSNFAASLSSAITQTVNQATLSTTIASDVNPSEFGQDMTFTATFVVVAPGAGSPTGTVTFFDGSTAIGSSQLDVLGVASIMVDILSIGTHSITAAYAGDDNFAAVTTEAVEQVVNRASTTVVVAASPNPSVSGQTVTFTATVSPTSPIDITPGGTVTFFDGMTAIGFATLVDGVATLSVPLTAGLHELTASYGGDPIFVGADSTPVNQVVDQAAAVLTIEGPTGSVLFGQPTTFTVQVAPAAPGVGTPTGTVTFFDGMTAIGTATVDGSGVATLVTTSLAVGSHSIFASYSGDSEVLAGDTDPISVIVAPAETQPGSVIASVSQSFFGQNVVFTATFSASAYGNTPMTGTVSFFDGDTLIGTVALDAPVILFTDISPTVSAQASLPTSALNAGNHVIRAVYSGDTNYSAANTANSAPVQVQPTVTSTSLNVATTPQRTTLTANVVVTSPGEPTVSGTVSFYEGTTLLGTAPVVQGVASLVVGTLTPGLHTLRAAYSGTANALASEVTTTVDVANTTVIGTVFLDRNANGVQDAGEPGLAGRVVFLDQNGDGKLEPGEPTATTAADGSFSLTSTVPGLGLNVVEATSLDTSLRYGVSQSRTLANGSVTLGVVPFSPIATVPVVPNPFSTSAPSNANTAFVQSLYRAVLGREGADSEVQGWLDRMSQGLNREGVTRGFVNSLENRTHQVEGYYQSFLGRSTDPTSADWVNALLSGTSEEEVVEGILNSPEYQSAHQDANLLVRDLYLDVLGRQGEGSSVAVFEGQLVSGTSRASVISQFVQSTEAIDQILEGFYSSYLRRGRDLFSSTWAQNLQTPSGSATSVAVGILASNEFFDSSKRGSV